MFNTLINAFILARRKKWKVNNLYYFFLCIIWKLILIVASFTRRSDKMTLYSCDILFKTVNKQNHDSYSLIFWCDYCWENHPSKLLHEREHGRHALQDLFSSNEDFKEKTERESICLCFVLLKKRTRHVQWKQKCRTGPLHCTIGREKCIYWD